MDTPTTPTVTLTIASHHAQDLRLRWMATSARRALAYARALLYVRSEFYRETVSHLPCGAQDGEADRIDGLEYNHEDGLWMVETLTAAIKSSGLDPVDSTSYGYGGDIASQHEAALDLLSMIKSDSKFMVKRLRDAVTHQQAELERAIARAGF